MFWINWRFANQSLTLFTSRGCEYTNDALNSAIDSVVCGLDFLGGSKAFVRTVMEWGVGRWSAPRLSGTPSSLKRPASPFSVDSSAESVGAFQLSQLAKRVIEGQFEYATGAKAVGFPRGDCVQALHDYWICGRSGSDP
jgi:hypothetical protein